MTSQSQIKGLSQSSTPSATPEGSLWYDTGNDILKASDGTSYNTIGKTSFAGSAVVSHSTTIGDYTTPTTAVVSSEGSLTTSDDFSSYADTAAGDAAWPTSDTTKMRVNPTNDNLDFIAAVDAVDYNIYYDLGASVSETAWVLRFKIRFSALTSSADAILQVGLFDVAAGGANTTQDGIMLKFDYGTSKGVGIYQIDGATANNDSHTQVNTYTLLVDTDYYCELKRTSATAFSGGIFSDSTFVTSVGAIAAGVTASTVDGLRYLKAFNIIAAQAGDLTGIIDDVKFFNGVTSANSANNIFDDSTTTQWISTSSNNPNVYVDMGSALNLCAIAFYWDSSSTETEIKIQSSVDAVTWTDKRKITTSNLTNAAYNYYRFNVAGGARYVRVYGTGSSKTLKIWEIKVLKKTDAQIFADLGIVEISNSDTSLDGDGV